MNVYPHRKVPGYHDMGRIRIPPLPPYVMFTDRDDGTLWALTHDSDYTTVALDDTISSPEHQFVYPANQGPLLDDGYGGYVEVFVRGGTLGFEPYMPTRHVDGPRGGTLYTRRGNESRSFILTYDPDGATLTYEEYDF